MLQVILGRQPWSQSQSLQLCRLSSKPRSSKQPLRAAERCGGITPSAWVLDISDGTACSQSPTLSVHAGDPGDKHSGNLDHGARRAVCGGSGVCEGALV